MLKNKEEALALAEQNSATAIPKSAPPHLIEEDEEVRIPTYGADGSRLFPHRLSKIESLLAVDEVVVRRNFRGAIKCAQYRVHAAAANPLRRSAHVGTRYSWQERVSDDCHFKAWRHRDLIDRQMAEKLMGLPMEDPEDLDLFVRAVFRAVPLSCMKKRPAPPTSRAQVIRIDSSDKFRPKRMPKPWEPDPADAKKAA